MFSAHIVNIWNSLPNSVVNACTVDAFKARLDRFWQYQLVKFDFTADLMGTETNQKKLYSDAVHLWQYIIMMQT